MHVFMMLSAEEYHVLLRTVIICVYPYYASFVIERYLEIWQHYCINQHYYYYYYYYKQLIYAQQKSTI